MGKVYHLVLANQPKAALDWRFNLLAVVAGKRSIQALGVLGTLHVVAPLAIATHVVVDIRAEGKVGPPIRGTIVDRRPHPGDARPHHADEVAHTTTRVVLIVLLKMQIQKRKQTPKRQQLGFIVFIGPESDHWQCLSLTDSLTD